MTRISATAAVLIGLVFLSSHPAAAQSDQDTQCFPWQEYRNGRCVAKPSQAPPPMPEPSPAPAAIGTCDGGTRSLSGQCTCPVNMHLDASGHCVADVAPVPPIVTPAPTQKADDKVICDGGRVSNGQCLCPAGFKVVSTSATAAGGMCVKTNAENCLGGELTVSGTCLCNGQVVMSGETYLLEYTNGKCVPKRCPVQTQWQNGKCVALSAVSPSPTPEAKTKPVPAKEASKDAADKDDQRPHCGRGTVRTRNGCVAARHKLPAIGAPPGLAMPSPGLAGAPPNLSKYYKNYQNQSNSVMPPN